MGKKVDISAQVDAVNSVLTTGEIREKDLAEAVKTLRLISEHPAYFRAAFKFILRHPECESVWDVWPEAEIQSVTRRDLPTGVMHDQRESLDGRD